MTDPLELPFWLFLVAVTALIVSFVPSLRVLHPTDPGYATTLPGMTKQ